jgi:hypothetical protein
VALFLKDHGILIEMNGFISAYRVYLVGLKSGLLSDSFIQ